MTVREPEAGVVRDPRSPAYFDRLRGVAATIPPAVPVPDDAADEEPER